MKKKVFIFCIGITILAVMALYLFKYLPSSRYRENGDMNIEEIIKMSQMENTKIITNSTFKKGVIRDQEAAKKIAEAIWESVYGNIDDKKPFIAKLDEKNNYWIVQGTLSKDSVGGVPYLVVQKNDGKVIAIWHDK